MRSNPTNNNTLIVIVGMCGAGKSLVAEYLKQKGWYMIRFGEITIHELDARDLPHTEANEREIREELRRLKGSDAYAKQLLPKIKEALELGPTVIDGLYSWSEYKFLRQNLKNQMYVLAVIASRHIRYERLAHRPIRGLSPEEAELRDFAEIENLEKGGPIAVADYVILNNGSKEEMLRSVDRLLINLLAKTEDKHVHKGRISGNE
jgi:dephospho-CoA kinase